MSRRKRAKSVALVVAAIIAIAPLVGLNALLWLHVNANGHEQIDHLAQKILQQVDMRLDMAMTALIGLGIKNVDGCTPEMRDHMSQATASLPFARDLAILAPDGEVVCSTSGRARVVRAVSSVNETLHPSIAFAVVDHGGDDSPRTVRLEWTHQDGVRIRLMVPASDLIPPMVVGKLQAHFLAQLVTADGTLLSGRLSQDDVVLEGLQSRMFESVVTSARYPVNVRISVPSLSVWHTYRDLFLYGNSGGLALGGVIMLVAWVGVRLWDGPERGIADAIRKGQFIAYYQPVIDLRTGALVGCEALVRWRKPDGRIVSPAAFIALTEANGQIYDITRAVLRRGRDDLEAVYARRPHLKVSFNLFAGHFTTFDIIDDVTSIFSESRLRLSQLVFEVTEREELPNMARARVVIARLQELGAQVALDDVGTGHGGLSYLLKLGVDQMKIDKMFVDAIGTDRYSTAIIDSMVRLADEMSMELVAEGVETDEQVEYLRNKGIRAAQGYIFAPPLPARSYIALVEAMCPEAAQPAHDAAGTQVA